MGCGCTPRPWRQLRRQSRQRQGVERRRARRADAALGIFAPDPALAHLDRIAGVPGYGAPPPQAGTRARELGRPARTLAAAAFAPPLAGAACAVAAAGLDPFPIDVHPAKVAAVLGAVATAVALAAVRLSALSAALAESRAAAELSALRLELALRTGQFGAWTSDYATGRATRTPELYAIYGVERRPGDPEPSRSLWDSVIHPDDYDRAMRIRSGVGPANPSYREVFRIFRRNDGALRHVEVSANWIPGGSGKGVLSGIVADITPLVDAAENARRASAARAMAMAAIGHDLGQPLQALRLQTDLLADALDRALAGGTPRDGDVAAAKARAQAADRALDRLDGMLRAMVDDAKAAAGDPFGGTGRPPEYARADVGALVRSIAAEHRSAARAGGVALRVRSAAAVGVVSAPEAARMTQNLIGNAIKYTPPGGRVLVCTRRLPGRIRVDVVDTGVGISPADIDRVWEGFQRAAPDGVGELPAPAGDGIGLASVRALAARTGARVGCSSRLGRGSRFWIEFPDAPGPAAAFSPPPGPPPAARPSPALAVTGRAPVLLLFLPTVWPDGESAPAWADAEALRSLGFAVEEHTSAEFVAGRVRAGIARPDAVVSAAVLDGGHEGLAALRAVRAAADAAAEDGAPGRPPPSILVGDRFAVGVLRSAAASGIGVLADSASARDLAAAFGWTPPRVSAAAV